MGKTSIAGNSIVARFCQACVFRTAFAAVLPIAGEFFPVVGLWIFQHGRFLFGVYALVILQAVYVALRDLIRLVRNLA